jgi:hypothetical protein
MIQSGSWILAQIAVKIKISHKMSQIGTIPASAQGLINQNFVNQFIGINDPDAFAALRVAVSGQNTIALNNANLIEAFLQAFRALIGKGVDAQITQILLPIADGYLGNTQFDLTATDQSTNDVPVFGNSERMGDGLLTKCIQTQINAQSNQSFEGAGFSALLFTPAANVDLIDITYENGFNDRLTIEEVQQRAQALTGSPTLAGGNVEVIYNFDREIKRVVIYSNATGPVTVAPAFYPL